MDYFIKEKIAIQSPLSKKTTGRYYSSTVLVYIRKIDENLVKNVYSRTQI